MNKFWTMISDLVPATWGVEGFIRINSNGATIADVGGYYWGLWALTGIYFVAALALRAYVSHKPKKLVPSTVDN